MEKTDSPATLNDKAKSGGGGGGGGSYNGRDGLPSSEPPTKYEPWGVKNATKAGEPSNEPLPAKFGG